MSRVTVAMITKNLSRGALRTIESVLRQEFDDFAFIVASDDDIKQFHDDPRIQCHALSKRPHFYNAALDRCSDFFATIDPGVVLLPGALQTLVCAFQKKPQAGVLQSFYFQLDENHKISRDQFRKKRERFIETIGSDSIIPDTLFITGIGVSGHFRLYRKSALKDIGGFSERTPLPPDYEALLRISESREIGVVPDHLYSWRGESKIKSRPKPLRNWFWTLKYMFRRQHKSRMQKTISQVLLQSFRNASGLGRVFGKLKSLVNRAHFRSRKYRDHFTQFVYEKIVLRLPAPSLNPIERTAESEKRIAYYIWHFPVLSQTFVNRELSALKKSNVSVQIIADEAETIDLADENARGLLSQTHYLLPLKTKELRRYKNYFFVRNPFRYLQLLFFVLTHRYGPFKNKKRDFEVFSKAVYLAGILKDLKITHLHSPWTDRCAFLSLVASQLLRISYSVQSRAHEIHRTSYLFGLRENLQNAHFVITNSEYNRSYLQSIVGNHFHDRIIRIYNGVDLDRFHPSSNHIENPEIFQLLCVARLIEQKGLLYLLKACRLMKDRGLAFQCEIIGGPEEELFINYLLDLRKLHHKLDLTDSVRFAGKLSFEKVLEKYRSSHIFVMPSVISKDGSRDITPNSLIEAMAMKLPVVSTTVTAIPEIVEDGVNGLLVPPNDEIALADAIMKLMQNPQLREQLGENARRKVEKQFDISANVKNYIRLFSGSVPV